MSILLNVFEGRLHFHGKTEGILLAGSADAAMNQPRPLSKTVRIPTAEAVWGRKAVTAKTHTIQQDRNAPYLF